jgi:phage tail sheath gpL-like
MTPSFFVFSVPSLLVALMAGLLVMPQTDVVAVNARGMGHEHTEPWRSTSSGIIRAAVSLFSRLRGHAWFRPAVGLAAALLLVLLSPDSASAAPVALGAISFNSVPSNLRVPFVAVEFDNTRAQRGPALLPYRTLLIGQRRSTGTATANSLHRVTSADQVLTLAGRGSMLHRMAKAYFANNRFTETWIGVLDDNGAGVAATGTITVTGPSTAAGTISLYLGGVRVPVAVASGTAQNDIATAIAAAINADLDLPVTAAAATNVVTVTFRHKGLVGNEYDIRTNYQVGESTPAGVSVAIVGMASGTTNPTLTTLIANLGDSWYQVIAHPYTDATSLAAIEAELTSRFGPTRMIDGVAFTAKNDTLSNLGTLGDSRNSPHSSIVATNQSPTPPMEYAAAVAAVAAYYGNIDPARPFQTLPLAGVVPPAEADLFTLEERNLLLYDGISTTKVVGSTVQIERLITTYKTNAAGSADTSYLDVTTMLTVQYLRYSFRAQIASRYPRHKLANDGTRYGAGQAVITPQIGKAEAINWFRSMEELGLLENFDQFKQDLVVERNASDPNRLDFLLPPDIINQLIVTGAQIQFAL